jgi:pilus assembly protein CpaD
MTAHISDPHRFARPRLAVLIGLTLALGGCMHSKGQDDMTSSIPNDYRQRHPITIQEADKTMEILVG